MVHNDVYKRFALYFPDYAGNLVECWFPNGKNSIRIRQKNKQEFIFTFLNDKEWRFETIDSYLRALFEKNAKKGASK